MVRAAGARHAHGVVAVSMRVPLMSAVRAGSDSCPRAFAHPVLTHSFRHSTMGPSSLKSFSGYMMASSSSRSEAVCHVCVACLLIARHIMPYRLGTSERIWFQSRPSAASAFARRRCSMTAWVSAMRAVHGRASGAILPPACRRDSGWCPVTRGRRFSKVSVLGARESIRR